MSKSLIKIKRFEKNLSQLDLANKIGSTQAYISKLERGSFTNPSFELASKIAKELDITLEDLYNDLNSK